MIQATAADSVSKPEDDKSKRPHLRTVAEVLLVFAGAAALLFLFSSRIVNVFDEGIELTGAMQTMAGQVLHRDFYYNYGPAQLYLLAGLFKLFGPSVLVERLTDISACAGLAATLYVMVRKFCDRALASVAVFVCVLWVIGSTMTESLIPPAVCILTLWTSWLILPVGDERRQRKRSLGAGFLAAVMFLVRHDTALGIVAANFAAVMIMMWLQEPGSGRSLRRLFATVIGPYLAAFAITVTPAAIAYLAVAPLHDLLYDVVLYMAKYYRAGRGLPFPKPQLGPTFGYNVIYLTPIFMVLGFWVVARWVMTGRKTAANESAAQTLDRMNLLVAFGVAVGMVWMRGLIRVGSGMIVGYMACVLLASVLLKHRAELNIWLRGVLTVTASLFVLTAISSAQGELFNGNSLHGPMHLKPMVINWVLTPNRQPPSPAFRGWCHESTPITRGFCFLLDEDHIQTVRYLDAHTRPGDYLYVGLDRHDRIFINDMITYFAVQRLPAVHWVQFDPFLQNRADIQQEMIEELERNKPPYVVLNSEFDNSSEPNGSSFHSGVFLLDDYISSHYAFTKRFGEMTILERRP
jgi:dolichyl-phosphate-mannose-protein mannosyltransferase